MKTSRSFAFFASILTIAGVFAGQSAHAGSGNPSQRPVRPNLNEVQDIAFDGVGEEGLHNTIFVDENDMQRVVRPDSESISYGISNVIVSSGGRVCLNPALVYSSVSVSGSAYDSKGKGAGRFTVNQSQTGSSYSEIYGTADNTGSFSGAFSSAATPYYFPGYFKLCVRNTSANSATVSLYINGY